MSILKNGIFAHNPNSTKVLASEVRGDGYSNIEQLFSEARTKQQNLMLEYEAAIKEFNSPISVSASEVNELLTQVYEKAETGNVEQSILTPIFMSVIDGALRSFKVSSKLGLTPSRVFNECENFRYENKSETSFGVDSLTEYAAEMHETRDRKAVQVNGKDGNSRDIATQDVRNQTKMNNYKKRHFDGEVAGKDEYSPDSTIYSNNEEAFKNTGVQRDGPACHLESAETDHIVPCKVVCNQLKKNKALTPEDIREIVNSDENLAVTSRKLNNAKRDKTNTEFVEDNKNVLSESEKQALLKSEKAAQKGIENSQNKKVISNLKNNRDVQKTFAKDAGTAALMQAGGDLLLYVFKPIYFEVKDCLQNGIEKGVSEHTFSNAIKIRFERVKKYILESSIGKLTGSALDFLKSFVSVLIEAIIGCLTGVFKMVWRLVKEGFKIVTGAVKILADKSKSLAEKGDAIMQLAAVSISAVAGIYIDGAVKNLGIPEPWSMLLASIASAVVASGILYLLNYLDLFNTRQEIRQKRILEILDTMNDEVAIETLEPMNNIPYVYALGAA